MRIINDNSEFNGLARFFRDKTVVVAGGTGVIGLPLVKILNRICNANVVVVSNHTREFAEQVLPSNVSFLQLDLLDSMDCSIAVKDADIVINLVGIKGSVGLGTSKVASFFDAMLRFQTNLIEASYKAGIQEYLFVSSVCGYPQSGKPKSESEFWNGYPRQNDAIPGVAKRAGEIQCIAYREQYSWDAVKIVRPSNVFGPFDVFDQNLGQVIPATISKIFNADSEITVWGDGSAERDFVFSEDVALMILNMVAFGPVAEPINMGSGVGVTIKSLVETLVEIINPNLKVNWDSSGPTGDPVRILDTTKFKSLFPNYEPTEFRSALVKTVNWYMNDMVKAG